MKFVALILLIVQIALCTGESKPYDLDLLETADKLLEQLNIVVANSQYDALAILHPLRDELQSSGEAVRDHYRRTCEEQAAAAYRTHQELIKEAEELGNIDMDKLNQCLTQQKYAVREITTAVINQIQACVLSSIDTGHYLIDSTIDTVETTIDIVKRLELKVAQCKLVTDHQDECILPIIEQISLALIELPERIIEDTDKCIIVTDTFEKTFDSCGGDRLPEIPNTNRLILKIIRECAGMPE